MVVQISQGDLFGSGCEALVNPVNCVGVLGAGLAREFKRRYPVSCQTYQTYCGNGKMRLGEVLVHGPGYNDAGIRWIVHFPTKLHWQEPSRLLWIVDGLIDLVDVIHRYEIKSIAIPALGCGLGGLDWDDVRPHIEEAMEQCEHIPEFHAFIYEPQR